MPPSHSLDPFPLFAGIARSAMVLTLLGLLVACEGTPNTDGPNGDRAPSGDGDSSAWFVERTGASGIEFVYRGGGKGDMHVPEITGGGVAFFDADADGDLDVYLANGGHSPTDEEPDLDQTNRFFRNEGAWRFVDATDETGLGDPGYAMGITVGDVDNDGDPDVFLTQYGTDRLYLNDGKGVFTDATEAAGLAVEGWSTAATFVDYDRDADLDLFIVQYIAFHTDLPCVDSLGRRSFCGPQSFAPMADLLYRNDGTGRFENVSQQAGISEAKGPGLGVVAADFDQDGWIDIYVANDGAANFLWKNLGDGRFEEVAVPRGAAFNAMGQAEAGMGVVAEDFDIDGSIDLFMTHLRNESNTLYSNQGGERGFLDRTAPSFPGAPSQPYTGFGLVPIDIGLDADLDLVVVNGGVRLGSTSLDFSDQSDLSEPLDRYVEPNQIYLNDGSGGFVLVDDARCGLCQSYEISRGAAAGDLDEDGDEDLLITNIEDPVHLYENRSERGRWLGLRIFDPATKRDALGARVEVDLGGRTLVRTVMATKGYVSSSDPRLLLGLGAVDGVDAIRVLWPDGDMAAETFQVDCLDCKVELRRGQGQK